MKKARFVLKFVALGLSIAASVCLVIAFWDRIMDCIDNMCEKMEEKKSCCCKDNEFEDFADF